MADFIGDREGLTLSTTPTTGNDNLSDTPANDVIDALAGNDTITVSQGGTDAVDGGADSDRLILDARVTGGGIDLAAPTANADGLSGSATWTGAAVSFQRIENFTIHSSTGSYSDHVTTGAGDDIFYHYGLDNTTYAKDEIDLGAGANDLLVADFSALTTHNVIGYLDFAPGHNVLTVDNFAKLDFTNVERLHLIGSALVDNVTGLVGDDILEGRAGNDMLSGGAGNDLLDGGAGNDTLSGNADDDTFIVTNGDDHVDGGTGSDTLVVDYGNATTAFTSVGPNANAGTGGFDGQYSIDATRTVAYSSIERFNITTGSGNDRIVTASGDDVIDAGAGDDFVKAGSGLDDVDGGSGIDGVTANLSAATGAIAWNLDTDTYSAPTGISVFSGFEYFGTLATGSGNDAIVSTDLQKDETFTLGDGDDTITVQNGRDEVHGGAGFDTLIVDYSEATTQISTQGGGDQPARPEPDGSGGYEGFIGDLINRFVQFDGIEKFVITTGSANDVIQLPNGENVTDDIVNLGGGNDETALGRGVDVADGGSGVDGLDADLSQAADDISIDLNANTYAGVAGSNFANFEYFTDRDGGFRTGTGNDSVVTRDADLDDNVRLGAGNDSVTIYNGTDFLVGYGLDTPEGEGGFDTLVVDYSAATTGITTDGGFLQGNADGYDGRLTDGAGGTRFALFFGFDRFDITTGSGNDVFNYFNLTNDADNVFHLGAGNDSVNLSQSSGDNYLDGGTGNDTMTGGFGNDTYVVDSASDVVNDFFGGIDEVRTSLASYTLASDLENLTGIGNFNQTLTGNASANVIDGGPGGDALFGLAGNDTLKVTGGTTGANTPAETVDGGADSDLLIIDYSAMTEQVGVYVASDGPGGATGFADIPDGTNRLSFTAVERLQITTGTGNDTVNGFQNDDVIHTGAGNDLIIANAGNDLLDGGTGADDMRGGDGNDTYIVDDLGDQITDTSGSDEVRTGLAAYTLADNVEILTGTSNAGQTLTGNAGFNTIAGAAGNDVLIGGGGDSLIGNGGDDLLQFGFAGGTGFSNAQGGAGGTDTLRVDFSAYAGAITTGMGPDQGGGNSGVFMDPAGSFPTNIIVAFSGIENFDITGTSSADTFTLGAGDDEIAGGGGNDAVDGGAGSDTAIFSGDRDDYDVTDNGDGTYTFVDTRNGSPDGTDTINHIEFVAFADGTLAVANLFDAPPVLGEPTDQTVIYTEDGPAAALLQGVILSDPDLPADFAGGSLGLTVGGTGGGLNLRAGTDFRVNSNGDNTFSLAIQVGQTQIGIGTISGIGTLNVQITNLTAEATPERINNLIDDFIYINLSNTPVEGDRVVTLTFTDAAANQAQQTQILTVVAHDDPAVAAADAITTSENAVATGNLLGNDGDVDGPAPTVAAVNGSTDNVGVPITLESGALLTVNEDGSYSYDPNHAFDATPAAGSGAANTPAADSFTYTLTGGATATVTVTVNGVDSNDSLVGTAGNDALIGGIGADTMAGLGGDDTYYVDNEGDVVTESAGQGSDRVAASVSYTLAAGAEVERLEAITLGDANAIDLTGNALGQAIFGNDGVNFLRGEGGNDTLAGFGGNDLMIGGAGADVMYGGAGDDIYYVDNEGDQANEAAGEGTDRIATSIGYALASNSEVELLEAVNTTDSNAMDLTGSDSANSIIGNAGVNFLYGAGGNDVLIALGGNDLLIGGTGADLMYGGTGNDTYYVDNEGDQANEAAGEGTDRIATSISYTLQSNSEVEQLEAVNLADTHAMDLTGSDSANSIIGNNGANVLSGAGGNDVLIALGGNDLLVGGAGNDAMYGGAGNDTYYVDAAGDQAVETAGEGNDRVATSVSYTLTADSDVETLEAVNTADTGAIDLTGNGLANTMIGNAGANVLNGGGGNDMLVGLGGADTFAFTTALGAGNVDRIADFLSGTDRIALDDAVFTGLGLGALGAGAFVTGTAAQDADDRIIYDSATGSLFFDADGNGAGAMVQFATLDGHPILTAGDFTVI